LLKTFNEILSSADRKVRTFLGFWGIPDTVGG